MVTEETKEVLAVIISFAGHETLDRWTQRVSTLLTGHAAAREVGIQLVQ
jgi:hypothetical protein